MTPLGTLAKEDDGYTVRLVIDLAAPPEEVWSALVEPALLAEWLTSAEIDPVPDGEVTFVWPGESEMHGVIAEIDPPRRLRYSWFEREYTSQLAFDIQATPEGSRLALTHRATTEEDAPAFGAGWQAHLESLGELLAGTATSKARRDARYQELRPAYDELVAGL